MDIPAISSTPAAAQASQQKKVVRLAREFESFFLYQMLELMQPEMSEDSAFSGGFGEEMFRHVLNEHMASGIAERGGIGIGDAVRAQLLKYQEVSQ